MSSDRDPVTATEESGVDANVASTGADATVDPAVTAEPATAEPAAAATDARSLPPMLSACRLSHAASRRWRYSPSFALHRRSAH